MLATASEDVDWEEIGEFPKYKFADTMLEQLESGREKDFDDFRGAFSKVVTLIAKKFAVKGVDDRYYLVSTDDGTASYNLKIAAEKIKISGRETA